MNSMNMFVKMSASFLVCLGYASLSAQAAIDQPHRNVSSQQQTSIALQAANESKLINENLSLLIKNGAFARKIATKVGASVPAATIPTTGTPMEQCQVMILQNQQVFRGLADKLGATGAPMSEVNSTDPAEKGYQLLMVNKGIVVSILKKLGIKPTPPTLTGSFVQKSNTLLKANAATLSKIATKLGVS